MQWGINKRFWWKRHFILYHWWQAKRLYGYPVKNILITLLINTSSNLKEKVIRIKWKLSVPRSMPSLFRLVVLKLFKHVFEYLMTIGPPPTPTPRYTVFTQRLVSGHVYEVNIPIDSWSPCLSIGKSKYQRDIAAKMKQLCYLIRTSHSSRSLGGTGYFLRWNRRGEFRKL